MYNCISMKTHFNMIFEPQQEVIAVIQKCISEWFFLYILFSIEII